MFSKACEYGIRASIYVAGQSLADERASLKDIARAIDSPVAFTAKILQQLTKSDVMHSVMGPTGGFAIEKKKLKRIKLNHVVDAIDGDAIYRGCGLGLSACNARRPCPVHDQFARIRDDLQKMLETTNLYELATGLKGELTFLRR